MLMETFTGKRPSDDLFDGDMTLRSRINDSFPSSIMQVVDCNLIKPDDKNFPANLQCVSSIMGLALDCTTTSPNARMSIQEVVSTLEKLKSQYLISCSRSASERTDSSSFLSSLENSMVEEDCDV